MDSRQSIRQTEFIIQMPKAVNPGEIYHVTYTDKGSLDFGILESVVIWI